MKVLSVLQVTALLEVLEIKFPLWTHVGFLGLNLITWGGRGSWYEGKGTLEKHR